MGSSSQRTSQTSVGPGKDQLARLGPQRVEAAYNADVGNPNRLAPQAQQYFGNVIQGNYLDPNSNPHLGNLVRSISDPIRAQTSAMFSRAGRGTSASSSGLAGAVTSNLATGLAPALFGQYNQERGFQQMAAAGAPAMDAAQSTHLDKYLEQMRAMATLDEKGKTTQSMSPLQMGVGGILGLSGLFGSGGAFPGFKMPA